MQSAFKHRLVNELLPYFRKLFFAPKDDARNPQGRVPSRLPGGHGAALATGSAGISIASVQ